MNPPAEPALNSTPPPVSLRPEQADDEGLLCEIFASTRAEELALTNWDENLRRAFLSQQFKAMRQGYRSMFPTGKFLIIELAGAPAGRMVINEDEKEIRVVDLALLPEHRNRGIGTFLMRQICGGAKKPVHLSVLKHNRAFHWYARLGFTQIGEQGVYDELEWRPVVNPASPTG